MIIFVLGLYFIFNVHNDKDSTKDSNNKEGYRNKNKRNKNSDCPNILVQQGNAYYLFNTKVKAGRQNMILDPSTTSIMGLMDASRDDGNYNNNMYAGFDPQDQYVGVETPLDKIDDTKNGVSANPMKSNWGGQAYTQEKIDKGKYSGDEVYGYGDSAMD